MSDIDLDLTCTLENETSSCRSTAEIIIASCALTILLLVTVIGNITVITAATTYHKLKEQSSTLFIVNLAATDLSVACLVMIISLVTVGFDMKNSADGQIAIGNTLCSIQCAMNYCLIVVSMMTLGFISLDRYLHILYPLRYSQIMTVCRIRLLLIWTWIQGLVIGFTPVVMGWINYDYGEIVCAVIWKSDGAVTYVIVACISCFIAPGLTMLVCYSVILKEIQKSMSKVSQRKTRLRRGSSSKTSRTSLWQARQKTSANQHKKIIKSLLVVVVIFFVCMTPFCVTKLVKVLNVDVAHRVNTLATFVQLAACACNPFIYGIFRSEFRKAFKAQYRKIMNRLQCGKNEWNIKKAPCKPSVSLTAYTGKTKSEKLSADITEYTEKGSPYTKTVRNVTPDLTTQVSQSPPATDRPVPELATQGLHMPLESIRTVQKLPPMKAVGGQINNLNGSFYKIPKIPPASSTSTPSILPETMEERLM